MCEPGEIVLIPFPYSDLSSAKRRPVLVLTKGDKYGDFICLAITSVETSEHAVSLTETDLSCGSLPKSSWIRFNKIFTLSSESIAKRIGQVKEQKK